MAKRSERIKVVRSIAEHEERDECRAMGRSQKDLDEELAKLEELKMYRKNYASDERSAKALQTSHWQDYYKFLSRLDGAVAEQEQVVRDGRHNQEVHRKRWMVKRQRLESLSRVVDRYRKSELAEKERRETAAQDSLPQQRRMPGTDD